MNHGYFLSLLWKGFRALALIPKEWDWGLLCAFGCQRAGNGRDGTQHPQVEWREKANPSLSRLSTFLTCCTVWSCTSAAWRGIWGSAEEPAASQPFSQQPSGKAVLKPGIREALGMAKGKERSMECAASRECKAQLLRGVPVSRADGAEDPWRFWGAADPEWEEELWSAWL